MGVFCFICIYLYFLCKQCKQTSALFVVMFTSQHNELTSPVYVTYSGPSVPVLFLSLRALLAVYYRQEAKLNGDSASLSPLILPIVKWQEMGQIFTSNNYKIYNCIVIQVLSSVLVTKLHEICNLIREHFENLIICQHEQLRTVWTLLGLRAVYWNSFLQL
jgi:hypothetical protein